MRVKIISTGSKGNSYLLQTEDGRSLLIDAGIKYEEILKNIDYKITTIDGVLISHQHL